MFFCPILPSKNIKKQTPHVGPQGVQRHHNGQKIHMAVTQNRTFNHGFAGQTKIDSENPWFCSMTKPGLPGAFPF